MTINVIGSFMSCIFMSLNLTTFTTLKQLGVETMIVIHTNNYKEMHIKLKVIFF